MPVRESVPLQKAVAGTKSEDVIAGAANELTRESRYAVKEVTLVLQTPCARLYGLHFLKPVVIDRFHIQKLACDAVQELRIKHRWDAIQQANT